MIGSYSLFVYSIGVHNQIIGNTWYKLLVYKKISILGIINY